MIDEKHESDSEFDSEEERQKEISKLIGNIEDDIRRLNYIDKERTHYLDFD